MDIGAFRKIERVFHDGRTLRRPADAAQVAGGHELIDSEADEEGGAWVAAWVWVPDGKVEEYYMEAK